MQGHRFPVMGIAWNHGENLLASSDFYGIVIVWKREGKKECKNDANIPMNSPFSRERRGQKEA